MEPPIARRRKTEEEKSTRKKTDIKANHTHCLVSLLPRDLYTVGSVANYETLDWGVISNYYVMR